MGSPSASAWLLALIGTIAGVVGAAAAVLQVLQGRAGFSVNPRASAVRSRVSGSNVGGPRSVILPGLSQSGEATELLMTITIAMWIVFILFVLWLITAIFRIRQDTIPIYVIMSVPAIVATCEGVYMVVFIFMNIIESLYAVVLWGNVVFMINIITVVAAIKVML